MGVFSDGAPHVAEASMLAPCIRRPKYSPRLLRYMLIRSVGVGRIDPLSEREH